MTRGGKRPGSGRRKVPDRRKPYAVSLSSSELAEIRGALDRGEAFSDFMRTAGLEAARRRTGGG